MIRVEFGIFDSGDSVSFSRMSAAILMPMPSHLLPKCTCVALHTNIYIYNLSFRNFYFQCFTHIIKCILFSIILKFVPSRNRSFFVRKFGSLIVYFLVFCVCLCVYKCKSSNLIDVSFIINNLM